MNGILPVWKPAGITSYDVIRIFKKNVLPSLTEKVKVGHAGTLDPFAEGVLLLLLGSATKRMGELQELPKTYLATAVLGAESDTLDKTGQITKAPDSISPSREMIVEAVKKFTGEIEQKIPDYSAAKVNGRTRYAMARRGETLPPKCKKVTIFKIDVVGVKENNGSNRSTEVTLLIECSSGTYVRQLSYDIFMSIGIESYLEKLVREKIGVIGKGECITTQQLADGHTVETSVVPSAGEFGTGSA